MVYTVMKFLFYPPNFFERVGNIDFLCFCSDCWLVKSNKKKMLHCIG